MKQSLILLLFLQSLIAFGQNEQTQTDKYNFDKECHEADTQTDVNICLYEASVKLSKVVKKKYDCIMAYFESEIKSNSDNPEIQSYFIKNKKDLALSQSTWEKLKEQNGEFYNGGGGTETPMLISQSIIKDYKDRLAWLDNLIEEEGQGKNNPLMKCE